MSRHAAPWSLWAMYRDTAARTHPGRHQANTSPTHVPAWAIQEEYMKHSIALSNGSHCLCSCGHLVAARTRIIALVEMTEHIEQEEAKEAEEA